MSIKILKRWTGAVLFSSEAKTVRDAMEAACRVGADLTGAYLTGANLSGADLTGAYLTGAYLTGANLTRADLAGAYLTGANLTRADLAGADLTRANLRWADLTGAIGIELAIARTRILPEGRLIGWKKCAAGVIVKLAIPEEARRSHAFGRKCRAEYAEVLEIIGAAEASSHTNDYPAVIYRVGETVWPANGWGDDWREECAPGIHFFITRAEAEAY